jgi:hypothetical protein
MPIRSFALRVALACAAVAAAGAFATRDVIAANGAHADLRDAPPPAYTGGFGEPTCQACHFEAEVNTGKGKVLLRGAPVTYAPGGVYRLTVMVTQPQLKVGGFELSARYENGKPAGVLSAAPADRARTGTTKMDSVSYIHHVVAGIKPVAKDTVRWALLWTAPKVPGTVVFHLAGNAGNEDDSPLGDFIYTAMARSTAGK